MSTFEDCLDTFAPYGGNMPLFKGDTTDATVTIIQEDRDDGMCVTRISTPPRTDTSSLLEAIDQILGLFNPLDKKEDGKEDKQDTKDSDKNDEKSDNTDVPQEPESADGKKQPPKRDE